MSPEAPATKPEALPRRAGGFELERELGRGGMGVVYLARELASGRQVALKVLLADLALSDQAFERFKREARVAAAISDSRCVFVFGAHQIDGAPAISMELVGGETLEHRIARGESIPIETAVRWTIEILEGLEAASMAGVVHRDVKPSNCFVTADGHVKVGDFGLSRALEADLKLTQTGQFLGSPLYASPEQVRGRDIDLRSDLYSCGATLYALLSGKAPHSGSNIGEVLARILSEEPPSVRERRPDVPRALERVIARAMARDPKQRFQTHADMRAALMPFVSSASVSAGLGMRIGAYLIDLACFSLLSSGLLALAAAFDPGLLAVEDDRPWRPRSLAAVYIQLAVPLLYFAVCEGLWGAAPGKLICGLRVTARGSRRAARARIGLRSLLFQLPTVAQNVALLVLDLGVPGVTILGTSGPVAAFLARFCTARPSNGWRGLHEILSGTRVVRRRTHFASVSRVAPPEPAPLSRTASAPASAGGYAIEGEVGELPRGTVYQAHDSSLERAVWLLRLRPDAPDIGDERRADTRPGRIRWLEGLVVDGERYDVFESPGGASWATIAARGERVAWPTLKRLLESLIHALAAHGEQPIAYEQLWIDRSWSSRILDAPPRAAARGDGAGAEAPSPSALLARAARAMLPAGAVLPADLPGHAEPAARKLFGLEPPFESLAQAAQALRAGEHLPERLTRRSRAAQLAFAVAAPVLLVVAFATGILFLTPYMEQAMVGVAYAEELQSGVAEIVGPDGTRSKQPLTDEMREAREILVADWWVNGRSLNVSSNLDGDLRVQVQRAVELHPRIDDAHRDWARANVGSAPPIDREVVDGFHLTFWLLPASATALWALAAAASALAMESGVSMRVFGVLLRDKRGRRASRMRCLGRSAIAWAPFLGLYLLPPLVYGGAGVFPATLTLAVIVLVHVAFIALSIWKPERGPQDHVLGTRLVPR